MKEFWLHTSIVLDSIAFFLVTLDLYGERRLLILQRKFKRIKSPEILDVIFKILDPKWLPNIFLYFSGIIVAITFYYLTNKYIQNYAWFHNHTIIKHFVLVLLSVIVWTVFQLTAFLLFYIIVGAITTLFRSILFIVKTKPVKVWMLPIGTALFIISRVISWIYT